MEIRLTIPLAISTLSILAIAMVAKVLVKMKKAQTWRNMVMPRELAVSVNSALR